MLAEAFGPVPWWCWLLLFLVGLTAVNVRMARRAPIREDWESSLDTPRGVR